MLGFLKRNNDFVSYMVAGKVDTAVISECCNQFSQQVAQKTSVLLDNAPVHRSQECIEQMPTGVKKDLIIKYLPPYSPELHLIEIRWRFIKYDWLPFSAYAAFQCLYEAVEAMLTRVGTEYTIAFQTV